MLNGEEIAKLNEHSFEVTFKSDSAKSLFLEEKCFSDSAFKGERNDMFFESIVNVFNDLLWFISGDAECKDIFEDENVKTIPINSDIVFPVTKYDTTIEKRTIKLVDILNKDLDTVKLKSLISKINKLYVFNENYIKEQYYLLNNYQLGSLKTKQTILLHLKNIG